MNPDYEQIDRKWQEEKKVFQVVGILGVSLILIAIAWWAVKFYSITHSMPHL